MPTTDHGDEEIEKFYDQLEEILRRQKGTDYVVVMGDMNAVVGEGREGSVVEEFGLGKRNERGERLIEFCNSNKMMVTNTWFQQEKRRRYTWKNPGARKRFQIDYILVKQRYRNSKELMEQSRSGCEFRPQPGGHEGECEIEEDEDRKKTEEVGCGQIKNKGGTIQCRH